jgi:hypothetical protein
MTGFIEAIVPEGYCRLPDDDSPVKDLLTALDPAQALSGAGLSG